MRWSRGLSIAVAAWLLAPGTGRAEPVTIKVGWVLMTSTSVPLSLEKKELLHHYGQSYVIEPVNIRATSAMITALGTGDVNVGTLAYSSLAFAIQNAKLNDLRIISDIAQNRAQDPFTTHFLVLKDGPIKKVEDMKGRVGASLAAGSAVDISMRAMLRRHGLDDRKDLTIVEAAFPNMKSMLLQHKADLVALIPPYTEDPALKEGSTTLFTQKDAMGPIQLLVWAGRADFIAAHRAAMVDFMEDSLRVTRYFTDPAHHEEVIDIVAKALKQPHEQVDFLFTANDSYRNPEGLPDLDALQHNIDTQREIGLIEQSIKVKDYADLGIVKEAVARLPK
jgi:NitT/TauT family transport system substrate-binding protein